MVQETLGLIELKTCWRMPVHLHLKQAETTCKTWEGGPLQAMRGMWPEIWGRNSSSTHSGRHFTLQRSECGIPSRRLWGLARCACCSLMRLSIASTRLVTLRSLLMPLHWILPTGKGMVPFLKLLVLDLCPSVFGGTEFRSAGTGNAQSTYGQCPFLEWATSPTDCSATWASGQGESGWSHGDLCLVAGCLSQWELSHWEARWWRVAARGQVEASQSRWGVDPCSCGGGEGRLEANGCMLQRPWLVQQPEPAHMLEVHSHQGLFEDREWLGFCMDATCQQAWTHGCSGEADRGRWHFESCF